MAGVGPGGGGGTLIAPDDYKAALNSHIYVYLIDEGLNDVANSFKSNNSLSFSDDIIVKASVRRSNGEGADSDPKDDGSSRQRAQGNATGNISLYDWWAMFWDMHSASGRRDPNGQAAQYLAVQNQNQRLRQQQIMQQPGGMLNNGYVPFQRMMPAQMNNMANNMAKQAMANSGRMNGLQQPNVRAQQTIPGGMPREEIDMTGQQRGSSPMGEGAVSSPKRQRLDGPGFQSQLGVNGTSPLPNGQQPNGAAPNASMLNTPFDPNTMSPATRNGPGGSAQQRQYSANLVNQSKERIGQIERGQPPAQGNAAGMTAESPMMAADNGQFVNAEMFPNGPQTAAMRAQMQIPANLANMPQNPNTQGGALADYQMQLMLLEQQNKRRLMMARQEQDVAGNQMIGPGGAMAPGMSPGMSRTGQSPPGGDGLRGSPAPPNMDPSQMPNGLMQQQFFPSMAGPNMMRNPMANGMATQQLEMMRRNQANGQWPPGQMPGPMMQTPMMQGPNDQRTSMPPPQAPGPGAINRNPPASPQQAPAPPTPSQANKTNPKGKKDKETKKKAAKKNTATTAATPTAEGDADDVPPPTPSTPKNMASNLIKGPAPPVQNVQPQPQMSAQPSTMNMVATQNNNNAMMAPPFGAMTDTGDMNFLDGGLDFSGIDGSVDPLGGFDFDSFLHDEPGLEFDPSQYVFGDNGLETGTEGI